MSVELPLLRASMALEAEEVGAVMAMAARAAVRVKTEKRILWVVSCVWFGCFVRCKITMWTAATYILYGTSVDYHGGAKHRLLWERNQR